jgi:hypothetical protein
MIKQLTYFIQFEIKINFQNKMKNLVEFVHLKNILSYSWKVNKKILMYWKNYMYF